MELTYDPRYNIAYIRFREKAGEVDTVHVSDELSRLADAVVRAAPNSHRV